MKHLHLAAILTCAMSVLAAAQTPPASIAIHVRETGGIRRTQFPVNVRVPVPRGALHEPGDVRLRLDAQEVPVQAIAESRWPDGSVQWLNVDLNASPGAAETVTFTLEYGDGVKAVTAPRGLAVTEAADSVQIGNIRFNTSGAPLIASVKYRDEAIGTGTNGLVLVDRDGASYDLSKATDVKMEIVKRGPLVAALRYTGRVAVPSSAVAFVLNVEMPSSKSWVKLDASVSDPGRRIREVGLDTPLALGPFPWVWDFGTSRWTYGSLRTPADAVAMTDTLKSPDGPEWQVTAGPKGREQIVETNRPRATFAGWGHVQGPKEVVAFAVDDVPSRFGVHRFTIDGSGQMAIHFSPNLPATAHTLTVYQHFVSTPVQIGAATSPAAILSPLVATCDRATYVKAGVPLPAGVR